MRLSELISTLQEIALDGDPNVEFQVVGEKQNNGLTYYCPLREVEPGYDVDGSLISVLLNTHEGQRSKESGE